MNYKDYKTASDRHLQSCEQLKSVIETKYILLNPTLREEVVQKELLSNIYYLSGYVIECILHYAIVEYVVKVDTDFRKKVAKKNQTDIESVSVRHLKVEDNHCGVGYDKGTFVLYRAGHRFQSNIDFFSRNNKLGGIDKIRGINGRPIQQENVKRLFLGWNVGVRYSCSDINNLLTLKNIFDFLIFTKEVHSGINNLILPQYA